MPTNQTTIIPIASGKGGVGKSFITANLGIALAAMGYSTVVVDLDLGGSNLNHCLGVPNRHKGIGDFLTQNGELLRNYQVQTKWRNLKLIPGDGRTPFTANLSHLERMKLIMRLQALPARFVLLDLGAGSGFNALDFFRISDFGLVVTTPEHPALMNLLTFLKNMIFRGIERSLEEYTHTQPLLKALLDQPIHSEALSSDEILRRITQLDPDAGAKVKKVLTRFRPRVILNKGKTPRDLERLQGPIKAAKELLSLQLDSFGFIFEDERVSSSLDQGIPLIASDPQNPVAVNIHYLADRIVRFWDQDLGDSYHRLYRNTERIYQSMSEVPQKQGKYPENYAQMKKMGRNENDVQKSKTQKGLLNRLFGR